MKIIFYYLLALTVIFSFGCKSNSFIFSEKANKETDEDNKNSNNGPSNTPKPTQSATPTPGPAGAPNLSAPENLDDALRGNSLTTSPTISWDPVDDASSYEIAIGTSEGATDVLDWTDVGTATSLSKSSLLLPNGAMLFASARAVGGDGSRSDAAEGDGWQNLVCPAGYIKVLGNETPGLGGSVYTAGTKSLYDWDGSSETIRSISDFCVMKYEVKDSGSGTWALRAVSTAASTPWVSIRRTAAGSDNDATEACEGVGDGFYLIGNQHWQAIAHDIESVSSNYDTSGAIADYAFNRGHANIGPSNPVAADPDDRNGCAKLTSNGLTEPSTADDDCGGGWHINRRTHHLANGEVIWDFSGNVWEWVRDDNSASQGSNLFIQLSPYSDPLSWGPMNDYTNQTGSARAGLGFGHLNSAAGAIIRSGVYSDGTNTGIFTAYLAYGPSANFSYIGFRCVFAP